MSNNETTKLIPIMPMPMFMSQFLPAPPPMIVPMLMMLPPMPNPYPPMGGYPPMNGAYAAPTKQSSTGKVMLAIFLTLLLIGGGVVGALLLMGKTPSEWDLGSASTKDDKVQFTNLLLTQQESNLTLTGNYSNDGKSGGTASIVVNITLDDRSTQEIKFTASLQTGSSPFQDTQTVSGTVESAELGSILFSGSSSYSDEDDEDTKDESSYPWEDADSSPTNNTNSTDENSGSEDDISSPTNTNSRDTNPTDESSDYKDTSPSNSNRPD